MNPYLGKKLCAMGALFALLIASPSSSRASEFGKAFTTPEQAVTALGMAVNTTNRAEFAVIFGSDNEWLSNPDPVQGDRELTEFRAAYNATNRIVPESDTKMILEVGTQDWPFPIPLVKTTNGWCFDTEAGRDEVLNRRIGRNELEALKAMREYVDAQREYASKVRDDSQVLKYAQNLASSAGKTDGLYWPTELNGEVSPFGPMVAEAQGEGYFTEDTTGKQPPQPFHGYLFRILKRQGKNAPGGKYSYVINGNMIGGFAMVAWPAEYGESGVMTFIVNQQGRVYQKDLGAKTEKIAGKMSTYDPDSSWQISPD